MNNTSIFTIVAKNYIGLGEILGKSLLQHNANIDFYIIVADEFEKIVDIPNNVKIARKILQYSNEEWIDMSFKYNLTEFCTAIKPAVFQYFFKEGYEKVIYFDPDIYIYSSIKEILDILNDKEIVVTPHICGVHTKYNGDQPEWNLNVNGIFNLGFCGAKNTRSSQIIMEWWTERLKDQCFMERSIGQFTDQKWMDWIPALGEENKISIIRNLGMNLAPWNFFERKIVENSDGEFHVVFREEDRNEERKDKLVFVHYSGFNYNKLKEGIIEHKGLNLNHYPDLDIILSKYGDAIHNDSKTFDKFISQKYSYARFDNNIPINSFHRRLYHGIPDEIRHNINPFSSDPFSFFYYISKAGLIPEDSNIASYGKSSVSNMEGKKNLFKIFFKILYKVLGFKRYAQFLKGIRFYSLPEMHTFLIDYNKIKS